MGKKNRKVRGEKVEKSEKKENREGQSVGNDNKTAHGDEKNPKKKKQWRKHKVIPKPGEQGYLTPSQLRNARKRRAKLKKSEDGKDETDTGQQQDANKGQQDKQEGGNSKVDPSAPYCADPFKAPIVGQAIRFFRQEFQFTLPVLLKGPKEGWRTVVKLPVRRRRQDGRLTIGLFAPKSHDIVAVPDCIAHHPSINQAVKVIQRLARECNVVAFDETTGQGSFRFFCANVERSSGKVQVTLVWKTTTDPSSSAVALKALCQRILQTNEQSKDDPWLHSLWIHTNNQWKHSNAIWDIQNGQWEKKFGPDAIEERLSKIMSTVPLFFPPFVFRQANLDAFAFLVEKIKAVLKEKASCSTDKKPSLVLELYGGVGTIGLQLFDVVNRLISSDENPHNKECFEKSVSRLQETQSFPKEKDPQITYLSKNASDMISYIPKADWVIVDPPRKGLDESVCEALCRQESACRLLVYVSCGFDAFQRDCRQLIGKGSWKLETKHTEAHILFPGSNAIETLAFFTR